MIFPIRTLFSVCVCNQQLCACWPVLKSRSLRPCAIRSYQHRAAGQTWWSCNLSARCVCVWVCVCVKWALGRDTCGEEIKALIDEYYKTHSEWLICFSKYGGEGHMADWSRSHISHSRHCHDDKHEKKKKHCAKSVLSILMTWKTAHNMSGLLVWYLNTIVTKKMFKKHNC